jgi:hypothetical protein
MMKTLALICFILGQPVFANDSMLRTPFGKCDHLEIKRSRVIQEMRVMMRQSCLRSHGAECATYWQELSERRQDVALIDRAIENNCEI